MILLLLACTPEQEVRLLPHLVDPPEVPDVVAASRGPESRSFGLDAEGGRSGAPIGASYFLPDATQAVAVTGALSDGSRGFSLEATRPGDGTVCLAPVRLGAGIKVHARTRLVALGAEGPTWSGAVFELRARGADGKLVGADGKPYIPLSVRKDVGGWEEWEAEARVPDGAKRGEVCVRFVQKTGKIEVDQVVVEAPGVPVPVERKVRAVRWELDTPGGGKGGPDGVDFLIPPGTKGATLLAGEVQGGRGFRMEIESRGNAAVCTQPVPVAAGMKLRGRVRVERIETDEREWTGMVFEVRTFNLLGGLASPPVTPYNFILAKKAVSDWEEFERVFVPPDGAVTGKLCWRFVESTGVGEVDWLAIGE